MTTLSKPPRTHPLGAELAPCECAHNEAHATRKAATMFDTFESPDYAPERDPADVIAEALGE